MQLDFDLKCPTGREEGEGLDLHCGADAEAMESEPSKRGWYWDPDELQFNEEVRQRWRTEGIVSHSPYYRLRWWDGQGWTDERLDSYSSRGFVPHQAGPGKLVPAFSGRQVEERLRQVVKLAVVFSALMPVFWVAAWLVYQR